MWKDYNPFSKNDVGGGRPIIVLNGSYHFHVLCEEMLLLCTNKRYLVGRQCRWIIYSMFPTFRRHKVCGKNMTW